MTKDELLNGQSVQVLTELNHIIENESDLDSMTSLQFYVWMKRLKEFADNVMSGLIEKANADFETLKTQNPKAKVWDATEFATVTNYSLPSTWQYPEELVIKETELKSLKELAKSNGEAKKIDRATDTAKQVTFKVTVKQV